MIVGFPIHPKTFDCIAKYFGLPDYKLLSISLAIVAGFGIHVIKDADRYSGEYGETLYKSAIAQTVVALVSTVASAILCKTFTKKTIGLLASFTLISSAGAFYKRPQKDNLFTSLLFSLGPYMMNAYVGSANT